MRPVLLSSESGDVRRASGTAVAVAGLVDALAANGVCCAVVRPRIQPFGHTVERWRFNRMAPVMAPLYDVIMGVGGDGSTLASRRGVPFVALPKALYAIVAEHERELTRLLIRGHARFEARSARAANLVVVPSRFAAGVVCDTYGVERGRVRVIAEPFAASRWRSELPVHRREGRRALLVAHLFARKRVHDVIAAWPLVRRHRPGAEIDVVGGGPELAALRRAAAGVPGVRLHGHVPRDRLPALYARSDLLVSTSAHETFGYAVVEGLASGLPIVAAAAPAVAELCAGAVAFTVPVADVEGLAAAVCEALDPAVADRAAHANPDIAARFEPQVVGAAYVDALAGVR